MVKRQSLKLDIVGSIPTGCTKIERDIMIDEELDEITKRLVEEMENSPYDCMYCDDGGHMYLYEEGVDVEDYKKVPCGMCDAPFRP